MSSNNSPPHQPAPFVSYREIANDLLFSSLTLNSAEKITHTSLPFLIVGEKGLAQTYLAQLIHETGFTKNEPFVEIHLQPDREHENINILFALINEASNEQVFKGSIFINAFEYSSYRMQKILLNMLIEQNVPLANRQIRFEGRIGAGIYKTFEETVSQGAMVDELLYKLAVAPIELLPLRQRQGDIPRLAHVFLCACAGRLPKSSVEFSEDAIKCLQDYSWPGNLPELESVICRSMLFSNTHKLKRENILFKAPHTKTDVPRESWFSNSSNHDASIAQKQPVANAVSIPFEQMTTHLVAELSHEIKNPLVAIKTFIQLFPCHMNDPEFLSGFFTIAEKSTDRINYLTERMLEFAKLCRPQFKSVSLSAMLQEALNTINAAGPRLQIAWNAKHFELIPDVRADFEHLRYSFENILFHIANNASGDHHAEITPEVHSYSIVLTFSYAGEKNVQGLAFHNGNGEQINDLQGLDFFLAQQVLQKNAITCNKQRVADRTVITINLSRY